jgi:hypothetical protein
VTSASVRTGMVGGQNFASPHPHWSSEKVGDSEVERRRQQADLLHTRDRARQRSDFVETVDEDQGLACDGVAGTSLPGTSPIRSELEIEGVGPISLRLVPRISTILPPIEEEVSAEDSHAAQSKTATAQALAHHSVGFRLVRSRGIKAAPDVAASGAHRRRSESSPSGHTSSGDLIG